MANPWTGEVALIIDGAPHVMKLTLGALAELETQLGEDTIISLVQRFESGAFSSRDVLALIVAGLRGGGGRGLPPTCWPPRSKVARCTPRRLRASF